MKTAFTLYILVALLAGPIISCSGSQKTVTVQQLSDAAAAGNNFYLIDVRTFPEFSTGHVPFTDDMIPFDSLEYRMADLPHDKGTTIYCFCRTGRRSGIATDFLTKQGYINVYNVEGGITAWQAAGFETVTGPLLPADSQNNSSNE